MKCPKCGNDMVLGEIASGCGNTMVYWAPKSFFDKHWLNTYSHTKKTIETENGILIKINSKIQKNSTCYGCKECKFILVDCN